MNESVIIIPCYNEELNLANTIKLIRMAIKDPTIVVINDGSKDKTSEIAKRENAILIDFKENYGKSNAIFAGLKFAKRNHAMSVLILDADLVKAPKTTIQNLIENAKTQTKQRKIKTFVAEYTEGTHKSGTYDFSGIRSFSFPAICYLLNAKDKKVAKGFGLEMYLNYKFKGKTVYLTAQEPIVGKAAFRNLNQYNKQISEISRARQIIRKQKRRIMKRRINREIIK